MRCGLSPNYRSEWCYPGKMCMLVNVCISLDGMSRCARGVRKLRTVPGAAPPKLAPPSKLLKRSMFALVAALGSRVRSVGRVVYYCPYWKASGLMCVVLGGWFGFVVEGSGKWAALGVGADRRSCSPDWSWLAASVDETSGSLQRDYLRLVTEVQPIILGPY